MDNVIPSPLLSIIIPLIGAALFLRPITHPHWPVQRWLYLVTVATTALAVLIAGQLGPDAWGAAHPHTPYLEPILTLLWMPLTSWAALLLFGGLLIGQLPRIRTPMLAEQAGLRLILLSSSVAILMAANLLALLLAWGVQMLVLLLLRAVERKDHAERKSPWDIWISLLSTGLLLIGAVAVIAGQEGVLFLIGVWPGLALSALSGAVGLRLVAWPMSSGLRRNWDIHLMSLVTGFYLWLRIGHSLELTGTVPGEGAIWVLLLAGLSLVAAWHRAQDRTLPYVVVHWIIVTLLAPLISPDVGFVASLLITMHLIACLLVLRLAQTPSIASLPWGQIPRLVAWASLGGLPFTAGFIGHWLLVRALWQVGDWTLIPGVLLSFLFIAVPAWVQARLVRQRGNLSLAALRGGSPLKQANLVGGVAALLALVPMVMGIYPGMVSILWPSIHLDMRVLGHSVLWGEGSRTIGLILATALAPLLAGLTWRLSPEDESAPWVRPIHSPGPMLDADWLYLIIREQVERGLRLIERGFSIMEGSFSLGWVLLWFIAFFYYLVGI